MTRFERMQLDWLNGEHNTVVLVTGSRDRSIETAQEVSKLFKEYLQENMSEQRRVRFTVPVGQL